MTRLYLNESLQAKETLILNADQSHYLARVLRYQVGDFLNIFNERDGEWHCKIVEITKKTVMVFIEKRIKASALTPPLWLAFAPLKNDAMVFLVEKATELGVTHLQPILTERCNTQRLNLERLKKNAIEAAQQCERLDIPDVRELLDLTRFIQNLPKEVQWFVALERAETQPIKAAIEKGYSNKPIGFIIGPEGGFTKVEALLFEKNDITPISLGTRILRAETAALSVLAIAGVWAQKFSHHISS